MKLALGTVQWGMPYGVLQHDQPACEDIAEILSQADKARVSLLDTAPDYGNSERVLGRLSEAKSFRLITKVPPLKTREQARTIFEKSLVNLNVNSLYGLLLHRGQDLLGQSGEALFAWLQSLKAEGRVKKIGVSVYTGEEVDAIFSRYALDLVQLPLNAFDQRLVKGGQLARLQEQGVEIHARSVFLQGVLLSPQLPQPLQIFESHLDYWRAQVKACGCTPLEMALSFVRSQPMVDKIVCGVHSVAQFKALLEAFSKPIVKTDYEAFSLSDTRLLNPANWPLV
jgi:aryl-alcohol dehydrogenase-like predicted oxidoreductase